MKTELEPEINKAGRDSTRTKFGDYDPIAVYKSRQQHESTQPAAREMEKLVSDGTLPPCHIVGDKTASKVQGDKTVPKEDRPLHKKDDSQYLKENMPWYSNDAGKSLKENLPWNSEDAGQIHYQKLNR